jgi:hypothetical protein
LRETLQRALKLLEKRFYDKGIYSTRQTAIEWLRLRWCLVWGKTVDSVNDTNKLQRVDGGWPVHDALMSTKCKPCVRESAFDRGTRPLRSLYLALSPQNPPQRHGVSPPRREAPQEAPFLCTRFVARAPSLPASHFYPATRASKSHTSTRWSRGWAGCRRATRLRSGHASGCCWRTAI